ncbi:MAG: DNA translocase FtsK 4TM domain-containing protein [Planctomycetota bacterium]
MPRSVAARRKQDEALAPPSPLARLLWLVGLTMWALVVASVVSHSPADPPGHAVVPQSEPGQIANWVGPVGARLSHELLFALGAIGTWTLVLGGAAWLGIAAAGIRVTHAGWRALGLLLVALALSGFHALLLPSLGGGPEGAGGLVALASVDFLGARFGALGSGLWLALAAAVGLTIAFDKWLVLGPAMAGAAVRRLIVRPGAAAAKRLKAELASRANDLDDDIRLRDERTLKKALAEHKAKKSKKEVLDEDAGGLGGADEFDPDEELVDKDEYEYVDEEEYEDEDEPEEITEEKLREKIAALPVRFANAQKKTAGEEDLEVLRAARASEEEADRKYAFPGLDLLSEPDENYNEKMDAYVREQAEALELALTTYGVKGEVVSIDSGPVITLYQVRLAPGTKVNAITSISSDIARSLKAINVRIVANTEGLDTVGIEVPNRHKERVRLKELMTQNEIITKMRLPMFLGKDASGDPLIVDLCSLPHLLIAGTTGSGKSVCMNAIVMGFLYTQRPGDLKVIMVDPKMVEMSQFRDIPHLMCPVITEMNKAAAILEWAVTKMDERYELLAEAGCRDIGAYNAMSWEELKEAFAPRNEVEEAKIPRKLPYIVFIIDELADLMMTNKEVEGSIVRIAQKARAVGIHLILATQRPQANVVTGLIKSNMPGRISFKVASGMDSRIVLDQKGGELLLGMGDMLMLTPRSAALLRAQGTLVEDTEIRRVVKFVRDGTSPSYDKGIMSLRAGGEGGEEAVTFTAEEHEERMQQMAQEDPLFDRAVEIVLETRRGSVSLLQRRLAIGYTRASRLIELMGMAGLIGQHKGTVAREVTMTLEQWHALKELADGGASDDEPVADDAVLFETDGDAEPAQAEPEESEELLDLSDEGIGGTAAAPVIEHKPDPESDADDTSVDNVEEGVEEEAEDAVEDDDDQEWEDGSDDGDEPEGSDDDEWEYEEGEEPEDEAEAESDEDGDWEYEYEYEEVEVDEAEGDDESQEESDDEDDRVGESPEVTTTPASRTGTRRSAAR